MAGESFMLGITALAVGVIHTLIGPDHYLPFVAMSQAGAWTTRKTLGVTVACGLGHVAGSVAIGCVGLFLGTAAMRLETLEALRGDVAAWLLIGFGLAYLVSGLMRATRHASHGNAAAAAGWAPWLAFLVFVFGPCEPLIPLLMYPAATAGWDDVAMVVAAFTLATVGTMTVTVMAMLHGLSFMPATAMDRFGHAWAGLAILACGVLVKVGL